METHITHQGKRIMESLKDCWTNWKTSVTMSCLPQQSSSLPSIHPSIRSSVPWWHLTTLRGRRRRSSMHCKCKSFLLIGSARSTHFDFLRTGWLPSVAQTLVQFQGCRSPSFGILTLRLISVIFHRLLFFSSCRLCLTEFSAATLHYSHQAPVTFLQVTLFLCQISQLFNDFSLIFGHFSMIVRHCKYASPGDARARSVSSATGACRKSLRF